MPAGEEKRHVQDSSGDWREVPEEDDFTEAVDENVESPVDPSDHKVPEVPEESGNVPAPDDTDHSYAPRSGTTLRHPEDTEDRENR